MIRSKVHKQVLLVWLLLAALAGSVVGCMGMADKAEPQAAGAAAPASQTKQLELIEVGGLEEKEESGEGDNNASVMTAPAPPPKMAAKRRPLPKPSAGPAGVARQHVRGLDKVARHKMNAPHIGAQLDEADEASAGLGDAPPPTEQANEQAPQATADDALDVDADKRPADAVFLPRSGYFENTYIGGNAAYQERMRRLDSAYSGKRKVWQEAAMQVAELDPPASAGLAVHAALSKRWLGKAGRVFLQVALRGSDRGGWSRPPLDIAVVVHRSAFVQQRETLKATIGELLQRLSGRDRIALLMTDQGEGHLLAEPGPVPDRRLQLNVAMDTQRLGHVLDDRALGRAMRHGGRILGKLAGQAHRIPGTQLVIALSADQRQGGLAAAQTAAHQLTLQGAVTSYISLGNKSASGSWWQVANAGHGNFHHVASAKNARAAVDAELSAISRVVARLVRVNVRLGPNAQGVRIIGSRMLGQEEKRRVKAREQAIDHKLSKALGVKADRGHDDDGLQTVIPYFYGGDRHAILLELQVDKPGRVADIEVRYKDLVNLDNATARTSVSLAARPMPQTPEQQWVVASARSAALGDILDAARSHVQGGRYDAAVRELDRAANRADIGGKSERKLLTGVSGFIRDNRAAAPKQRQMLEAVLDIARKRQVGVVK